MDSATVSAQEIRADFAQRLVRRFEGMATGPHEWRREVWEKAARVVQLVLDECDSVDEDQ